MMEDEDCVELKFRLADGTDIGPSKYNQSMTVASLKEKIIAQWPKDKENAPKMINEVKLINGGKILENDNKTLSEIISLPTSSTELPPGMLTTTMHLVLRPPLFHKNNEKLQNDPPMSNGCACCIL